MIKKVLSVIGAAAFVWCIGLAAPGGSGVEPGGNPSCTGSACW